MSPVGGGRATRFNVTYRAVTNITLVLSLVHISLAGDTIDSANWKLGSWQEAVNAAFSYTGFQPLEKFVMGGKKPTGMMVSCGDETPFLSDSIAGRDCWLVSFDSVRLVIKGDKEVTDETFRHFDVILEPITGRLIRITSEPGEHYRYKPRTPTAEEAEKIMNFRQERYHGFPDTPPRVTFIEALKSVIGDPFSAKEIHALYVLHSRGGAKPRPVWIIDLRGLDPPMPTMGGPERTALVPIEQRNHMRSGVDAVTGVHLFSTTMPQVDSHDTSSNENSLQK